MKPYCGTLVDVRGTHVRLTLKKSLTSVDGTDMWLKHSSQKSEKLNSLYTDSYTFLPLAFESLEPKNAQGLKFVSHLNHRISNITGELHESPFYV